MQNPHLIAAVAAEHIADLHRDATARKAGRGCSQLARREARTRSPGRVRRRAGWWLVTFGLRLATGPAVSR